jgi:hypothetical protein
LEDDGQSLPQEEVEVTSNLQVPSPTPSSSRPKRNIQPTKQFLEYMQGSNSLVILIGHIK